MTNENVLDLFMFTLKKSIKFDVNNSQSLAFYGEISLHQNVFLLWYYKVL